MKNWELIAKLSELPAGADILAGGSMTGRELTVGGVSDTIDGEEIYSYLEEVIDVDADGKRVYLQLN